MKPKLGVVVSTFDRVDDARINLEILRARWSQHFDLLVVHAFNGLPEWLPEGVGIADKLIKLRNRGHFRGAVQLMESGLAYLSARGVQRAVHLSSDTWACDPEFIRSVLDRMERASQPFASSAWGDERDDNPWRVGLAMDFAMLDLPWAFQHAFLPIEYERFCDRHGEAIEYAGSHVFPERVLAMRFLSAVMRADRSIGDGDRFEAGHEKLCRISEREPVHRNGRRVMTRPAIGLCTSHDAYAKRYALSLHKIADVGPHARRLADVPDRAESLAYYNAKPSL